MLQIDFVDEIPLGGLFVNAVRDFVGVWHGQPRQGNSAAEPDQDGGLATSLHRYVSVLIDGCNRFIGGRKLGPVSDVDGTAIVIMGADQDLRVVAHCKHGLIGRDGDAFELCISGVGAGGTISDPLTKDFIVARVDTQSHTALVSDCAGGFGQ
ncbi:hypothetical protein SV7mr_15840 [Stieleria bergensis]|uniref:Uncharacterized protein n=1 Tax=Stieleria bergensis TaxID=2528025 RepID=A0A517SSH8_9BACT|nr:hypothetical protein SV7mr_15840 [Planctomycetes bacterium SV_7m_r]